MARRNTPWTREEFMKEALRSGGTDLVELHEQLLKNLQDSPLLEARFNGRGGFLASYNVHTPKLVKELLRVRASGDLQASIGNLQEKAHVAAAKLYRNELATWIADESGGFPHLSKRLGELDFAHLTNTLARVAEKLGHEDSTADERDL